MGGRAGRKGSEVYLGRSSCGHSKNIFRNLEGNSSPSHFAHFSEMFTICSIQTLISAVAFPLLNSGEAVRRKE